MLIEYIIAYYISQSRILFECSFPLATASIGYRLNREGNGIEFVDFGLGKHR